ncbi:MAG: hypothetical protein VX733_01645 [Candidatus Latescibacterota bacterium]|nr:hypothetical protein [Candidatus Latescibacterota bacterium]
MLPFAGVLWSTFNPAAAKQLTITSDADWQRWTRPGNAIAIEAGSMRPAFIRRDTEAVGDASRFSGGIRGTGTRRFSAGRLIDGNPESTWIPDPGAPADDWWIEVDLGRAVSTRTVRLLFAENSAPLEFFHILTSSGESFFNTSGTYIDGTVRYNGTFRYSFNAEVTSLSDPSRDVDYDHRGLTDSSNHDQRARERQ